MLARGRTVPVLAAADAAQLVCFGVEPFVVEALREGAAMRRGQVAAVTAAGVWMRGLGFRGWVVLVGFMGSGSAGNLGSRAKWRRRSGVWDS